MRLTDDKQLIQTGDFFLPGPAAMSFAWDFDNHYNLYIFIFLYFVFVFAGHDAFPKLDRLQCPLPGIIVIITIQPITIRRRFAIITFNNDNPSHSTDAIRFVIILHMLSWQIMIIMMGCIHNIFNSNGDDDPPITSTRIAPSLAQQAALIVGLHRIKSVCIN